MAEPIPGQSALALDPSESVHPSRLDAEAAMVVFKQWFRDDATHSRKWRDTARVDFDFAAGEQWSPEDQQLLKNQMRPAIVFNRALTVIKCVAGMEINGRHEISFLSRTLEDASVNETLNGASKWMDDSCDAEDEQSDAFLKSVICGMGWIESRLSYEERPNGKYIEESTDPLEHYWDCRSKKPGLTDARRLWRVRKIPVGEAMDMFPGKTRDDLDASWALNEGPEQPQKTLEERRVRDENIATHWADRDEVTLICLQWYELEDYWRVADPATNKIAELSAEQYQTLNERMKVFGIDKLPAVKMRRRVYRQAFIGGEILSVKKAPLPDRFSWTPITGELHHTKGTFFGLVRVMKDPQMWSNKWLSQSLHILNTTAKGGILAEKGAFEDEGQAERSYAQPQAITWVSPGSISGNKPKIMPKPGSAFPQGHMQLMELAITALRDVTGINYELLGLKDVNQPGILEAQRKQAGMTVLATMFNSLRKARKTIGHVRLFYIQNFLSDGRLIRITGKDGMKNIPLLRDKCLGEYDVVVSDAPTSPNQKEANWQIILQMLPTFGQQLAQRPEMLAMILEYSPLPDKLIDAVKAAVQNATADPNQQVMQQLAIKRQIAAIDKDQSTAELQNAKAGATQATATYDLAMAQNLFLKHQGDLVAAAREWQDSQRKAASEADLSSAQADQARAAADHSRARAHAARIGAAVDALSPIPHAAAGQDAAMPGQGAGQGRDASPAPTASAGLPAGAQQAPDGNHYVPDPSRSGKYLQVVPRPENVPA